MFPLTDVGILKSHKFNDNMGEETGSLHMPRAEDPSLIFLDVNKGNFHDVLCLCQ